MKLDLANIRTTAARWLAIHAAHLLGWCLLLIILAFYYASRDGMLPAVWGEYEGNHGPWRHYCPGRPLMWEAVLMPIYASGAALLSLFLRPDRKSRILLAACIGVHVMVIAFFYWLID
jgi:hypothetical protein